MAIGSFLAFVVAVGREIRRVARNDDRLAPGLLTVLAAGAAFAVTGLFMTAELTSSWSVWVLAGAAIGVAPPTRRASPPPTGTPVGWSGLA